MPIFELSGKTAVVTGAGSGIGLAIATLFAAQGANVQLLDIGTDQGEAAAQSIRDKGGKAHFYKCDVSKQSEVRSVFDTIFEATGKLNILVNNAGVAHVGTVETTTEEDMDRLYAINVKGVFNCLKAGIEKMLFQGGGVILNLSSIAAVMGLPDRFAYSMTKGAVQTMTISVATDYVKKNIRCNCICPARIHTPFVDGFLAKNYPGKETEMFQKLSAAQPVGRMGAPHEVAHLALYLCSDEASFITGAAYPIDGGVLSMR